MVRFLKFTSTGCAGLRVTIAMDSIFRAWTGMDRVHFFLESPVLVGSMDGDLQGPFGVGSGCFCTSLYHFFHIHMDLFSLEKRTFQIPPSPTFSSVDLLCSTSVSLSTSETHPKPTDPRRN